MLGCLRYFRLALALAVATFNCGIRVQFKVKGSKFKVP